MLIDELSQLHKKPNTHNLTRNCRRCIKNVRNLLSPPRLLASSTAPSSSSPSFYFSSSSSYFSCVVFSLTLFLILILLPFALLLLVLQLTWGREWRPFAALPAAQTLGPLASPCHSGHATHTSLSHLPPPAAPHYLLHSPSDLPTPLIPYTHTTLTPCLYYSLTLR